MEERKEPVDIEEHKAFFVGMFKAKYEEVLAMEAGDFKDFQIPLARVKKIMKSDEDVCSAKRMRK